MKKFFTQLPSVSGRGAWPISFFCALFCYNMLSCIFRVSAAHAEDLLGNVENLVNVGVKSKLAKSPDGQDLVRVELALTHPPELKTNSKAPWKFEWNGKALAQNSAAFVFENGRVAFAKDIPTVKNSAVQNNWQLTYFICDKEEKWCKRVVKKGSTQ